MSIDVEDWFQVENLKSVIARNSWGRQELRVERNVDRMLGALSAHGARATFFLLGWIADACPGLVRRIQQDGHEIASHGYGHELVYGMSPEAFREDVIRAKGLLEDIGGEAVRGYRAPNFSITDWAVDILEEVGIVYDSSVFPTVAHDRYGRLQGVDSSRSIFRLRPGFYEVVLTALPVAGVDLPWAGGAYFRLLPYPLFLAGVRRARRHGRPYVFYIHPWELDPGQPRVAGLTRFQRIRHYTNVERCEARWNRLLGEIAWIPIAELLAHAETADGARPLDPSRTGRQRAQGP